VSKRRLQEAGASLSSIIKTMLCNVVQVPKKWREELRERQISTGRSKLHHSVTAADGTRKFLLQLHDGLIVEAVGIPADDADKSRLTACVSSQVTLSLSCICASVHLCICTSVHLCICASVHLCICASVHLCICASVTLHICASVPLCLCACARACAAAWLACT